MSGATLTPSPRYPTTTQNQDQVCGAVTCSQVSADFPPLRHASPPLSCLGALKTQTKHVDGDAKRNLNMHSLAINTPPQPGKWPKGPETP